MSCSLKDILTSTGLSSSAVMCPLLQLTRGRRGFPCWRPSTRHLPAQHGPGAPSAFRCCWWPAASHCCAALDRVRVRLSERCACTSWGPTRRAGVHCWPGEQRADACQGVLHGTLHWGSAPRTWGPRCLWKLSQMQSLRATGHTQLRGGCCVEPCVWQATAKIPPCSAAGGLDPSNED